MNHCTTLPELLSLGNDNQSAIGAPDQLDVTFKSLRLFITQTVAHLNSFGIGRNDRVAIVLDNGPEMALAFMSIASGATSAPLNSGYRADEFKFYLEDLKAKAIVVKSGSESSAIAVAEKLGVAIIDLLPTPECGAGTFTLSLRSKKKMTLKLGGWAKADDIALILHTSGTTSRPKIVPLSQSNVCASAGNIANTLAFTTKDRGLNPLRFIRSSSSSMPVKVIEELEACFKAPLIESYGMTEASHQMCSNLLPPALRKPGTVGVAAGPRVAIMDEQGKLLDVGQTGEIVIQGANVTKGYENNPKANAENFTKGWFRTGDQGTIDADGYVTITGRLKEIINRGGEKISPREVDEILMEHPAILQVVTFAIPHEKLGEEVGVVVVLREGKSADEKDIRSFAAQKLADFKVPKKIIFMDEIPKGATGKLQRIGLASKLGL